MYDKISTVLILVKYQVFSVRNIGVSGFFKDLSLIAFLIIKSNKTIQFHVDKLTRKDLNLRLA